MNMRNIPRHLCEHRDCPHFGEVTYSGCRCHKTTEQMLMEQRAELAEILRDAREWMIGISPSMKRLIARTDAVLDKVEGHANG